MKKGWSKYLIAVSIGTAILLAILFGKGYPSLESAAERFKLLSDAFLVSGLLLLLSGCLVWIMRQGTFSGMGYTFRRIFVSLHSKEYRDEHKESFAEYRERKSDKKTPFLFLILTGSIFLIPAIAFTLIYIFI